jgi:hydrogenase/urease accessory protein HupE
LCRSRRHNLRLDLHTRSHPGAGCDSDQGCDGHDDDPERHAAHDPVQSVAGSRQYGVFAEGGGVVDDHTSLVDYALGGESGRFVFDASHRDLDVGHSSALSTASRFVGLGAEHILRGLDHVLFVIALLLGATGLTGVLKVASAFTLAHSLTLALAVIGWVQVPGEVVEPLIALSIA